MLKTAVNLISSFLIMSGSAPTMPDTDNIESRGELLVGTPEEKVNYMFSHCNSEEDVKNLSRGLEEIAKNYDAKGNFNRAEIAYLLALQILKTTLTKNDHAIVLVYERLAEHYALCGEGALARRNNLKALEILKVHSREYAIELAVVLHNQSWLELYEGNESRAEKYLLESLSIVKRELGEKHQLVGLLASSLAEIYMEQGAYRKAEPYLQLALQIVPLTPSTKELSEQIRSNYACVLRKNHKYSAARSFEKDIK